MARVSKTGGKKSKVKTPKASHAKVSKTANTKRHVGPAATRRNRVSVSALTEQLKQSQEQQKATAEILKVINASPGDLTPVFDAILENAARICGAAFGVLFLPDEGKLKPAASQGVPQTYADFMQTRQSFLPDAGTPLYRVLRTKAPVFTADDAKAKHPGPATKYGGARSLIAVPIINEDRVVGAFVIYRTEVKPFTEKQVELLSTFADQANLAIQNARLFNETKEALERQTATAEILKVIASSPSDVQPVFDAIAKSAKRLSGGHSAVVTRVMGDMLHLAAFTKKGAEADQVLQKTFPFPLSPFGIHSDAVRTGEVAFWTDIENDLKVPQKAREVAQARGYQSLLAVPLLREGISIGTIGVVRREVGPFEDSVIGLLKTFADQAVIAIENARLFNETKEALERQTATADILKVIASSPSDTQPVFEAIAEKSNRLVDGFSTVVYGLVGDMVHLMALTHVSPVVDAALKALFPRPFSAFSFSEAFRRGEIVRIADTEKELGTPPSLRDVARLRGWRSWLAVPLIREGGLIGVITVTRVDPGLFADQHVELLKTFADQAVIAISNVGLFKEVQKRTRELSQSLDDLRATQDRLVQTEKLASLGQLTAGIAHEIKNPLNFVNNFSALSAELTDELNDVLKPVAMDDKVRGEVSELTRLLKDNLEKVVQHGKRADSIVKNMLLHSREGSGEHRSTDINALVEESLNLAYHGARAEKPGFNVTLTRELDPEAGTVELYPQEITRALLNLISNGFYAATKRKSDSEDNAFEPTLSATTKNLGNGVEIRIRDNGTGIPPEVKEKMFNPFFTTKPAGEGTGLGLSMTHDIIVKQHGGTIDVETEPGAYTEFVITLPRTTTGQTLNGGTN